MWQRLLLLTHLLDHQAVTAKCTLECDVLLPKSYHLLGYLALVVLASLQFFLGDLYFVLDVSQEQVLVQRMNIADLTLCRSKTLRRELGSRWSKTLH